MPDIDTSQYPKLKNSNPLETISGFAGLQNTLNQNKLFQQQFQTNKAVSDIYKRAVKPDGTLDMDQIRDEVGKNPDAAYGLEQVFKGAQGLQQGQIATDTAQLENQQKHWQAVGSFIQPLLALGNKATSQDVTHQLAAAMTAGLATPDEASRVWATVPRTQDGRIDETKIPAWSQQMMLNLMDRQSALNATNPVPTMQDIPGGGKAPFAMRQFGGVSQVGPTIGGAPAPTTTTVGPDNVPRYIGNPQGNNPYEAEYQKSQGQNVTPGGGMAPGGNIAGLPAGMSPAAAAASQKSGGDSAEQLGALRSEVGGSANRVLQLQNASAALEGALTGKGSQKIQDLRALLVTSGVATDAVAEKVKNFDEAKKYLLGSMLNRGAGLGINTNEKLAALSGASPNTDISQLAAKDIIRTNIGLEKAQQAQYAAFKKAGLPPEQFTDWAAQWNTGRDLRAYSMAQKPAAERKKFVEGLKPAERAKFAATLTEGVRLGILPLSDFAK